MTSKAKENYEKNELTKKKTKEKLRRSAFNESERLVLKLKYTLKLISSFTKLKVDFISYGESEKK